MTDVENIKGLVDISGFGSGYEETCQNMLQAGYNWLVKEQKKRKIELSAMTYRDVYGIFIPISDNAKELSKVIVEASGNDCTGAMHQAVMSHLFYIWKYGVDKWKEDAKKRKKARAGGIT